MSVLLVLILTAVLFMISLSLVLLVIGPSMLLQPHRRTVEFYRKHTRVLDPKDAGLKYEELTLKTREGINLSCWFIKARQPARGTIIYLHGVSECKIVGLPMTGEL